jgi:allantoinase
LFAGEITSIGSDHSPSPLEMKRDANYFKVWGGISSVQHTLPLLLTGALEASQPSPLTNQASRPGQSLASTEPAASLLCLLAAMLSKRVAARFKLPRTKGCLELGADADLALVDLRQSLEVRADDLLYRHRQTPYVGRSLRGRVVRTLLRGKTIFENGKFSSKPSGHLVRPLL